MALQPTFFAGEIESEQDVRSLSTLMIGIRGL